MTINAYTEFLRAKAQTAVQTGVDVAEGELMLPLDPTVKALISREISITTFEGLPSAVKAASVEQLQEALELLSAELRRGRGPVLEIAIRKKAG